jgi:hypothetical protein
MSKIRRNAVVAESGSAPAEIDDQNVLEPTPKTQPTAAADSAEQAISASPLSADNDATHGDPASVVIPRDRRFSTNPSPETSSVHPPAPLALTKSVLADMADEELDRIAVDSLVANRARLIPVLKELRRRYSQQGRRIPVPGFPTWKEYAEARTGRTIRTVQYWLEEPSAKVARGSKSGNKRRKPQLDPDPAKWTRKGESVDDARTYCRELVRKLPDEAKADNPFLMAFTTVSPTATLRDIVPTLVRYFVRNSPREEQLSNAEIFFEAAQDELNSIREQLNSQAMSTQATLELSDSEPSPEQTPVLDSHRDWLTIEFDEELPCVDLNDAFLMNVADDESDVLPLASPERKPPARETFDETFVPALAGSL